VWSDSHSEVKFDCGAYICYAGAGEQGQLGRVPECFSSRGGRRGLGKQFIDWLCLLISELLKLSIN